MHVPPHNIFRVQKVHTKSSLLVKRQNTNAKPVLEEQADSLINHGKRIPSTVQLFRHFVDKEIRLLILRASANQGRNMVKSFYRKSPTHI